MMHRRNFFKSTALTIAATQVPSLFAKSGTPVPAKQIQKAGYLNLGMAGYTFLNFTAEESISMMKRVGIQYTTLKDFHLPFNSSPERITEIIGQFKSEGIQVYGVGVIYMKSTAEIDRAFAYAKQAGVEMIVGVPNPELIAYSEQQVKQYNIKLAIHNHGPEDKLYPGPSTVYNLIKNMDARMGLCLDIGHATRAGEDPTKAIQDYAPRIFDLHIKDLVSKAKDAKVIEVGRGVINFPELVNALYKIKYTGKCSIEFEKDMNDPLPGIAESAGYFRGVMKTLGDEVA